jgi:hypothetical protein
MPSPLSFKEEGGASLSPDGKTFLTVRSVSSCHTQANQLLKCYRIGWFGPMATRIFLLEWGGAADDERSSRSRQVYCYRQYYLSPSLLWNLSIIGASVIIHLEQWELVEVRMEPFVYGILLIRRMSLVVNQFLFNN